MTTSSPTLARRDILKGAAAASVISGASLATLLADPALARAAAETTEMVEITTADGQTVKAAVAYPETSDAAAPAVILIHEWWGLNDQIRTMAAELAKEGYVAVAVDLYNGVVTSDPTRASSLSGAVNADRATATLTAWNGWLAQNPKVQKSGERAKVATIGWCFGGGWSLNASIAFPVDGTVIYYGRVTRPASDLAKLNGPVLGHFATRDEWITQSMVSGFEKAMAEAQKPLEVHWYEADHAFANPTGSRYDAEDAMLAWQRTTAFLTKTLKG